MLLKAIFPSVLFLSFVALPLSEARAEYATLLAASQWQVAEEADAYLHVPVCRAFTQASTSADPIELSLAYAKDGKTLPMIGLRTKLAPALIAIKISKKETEYFFPLQAGATNADSNLYWYAPLNFTRLEALVHDGNTLDIVLDPKGAATAVKISLKGSGNALDAAKKCLKAAKGEVPTNFFKLLNGKKESFTPDLGNRTPALMFQSVQNAFDAYQAGQVINAEIAKLRKANAPMLEKEKSALSVLKKATTAFTSAKTKLDTAQTLVSNLTANLEKAKADLAAFQAEKPKAEADLAAKKAIYLPLKAQMLPYEKNVTQAQAAVNETSGQIESDENLIDRYTRLIPQYEAERRQLLREIPGLEQRSRNLRREYDDADSDYRRYDVRRETENFLNRDSSYSWAKRDLDEGQRELSSAQSRLYSAQSALSSCRATPNANCSLQQSAVYQANSDVSSAQSKISSAQWKISNAESDAARQANSESDRLRRIRDDAESAYDSAYAAWSNAQNRADEIRSAIPRMKQKIAEAEAELPGLRELLVTQQAALAARTKEYSDFSQSIGFGVAEANYNAATKHLAEVGDGIKDRTKVIPKITKDLAAAQKTIPALTKTFTRAQAELTAAEAKLAPIAEQLKPFRELEKVQLDALEVQSQKFKVGKATYQELYLELIR